jgi:hypothetical protein
MNHKKIEMPTAEEKRRSISIIMEHAPRKQQSYFREIDGLLRLIGVRGLFFGVADAAFLAVTAALIIGAGLMAVSREVVYSAMFFSSPLTYILLYSLIMWKESLTGTLDLHRTLKISTRHITAVRMLFFGSVSIAVNGVISAFAVHFRAHRYDETSVDFLRLLEISFCSLFVFAALLLFIMLKFRSNKSQIAFISTWCFVGAVVITPLESLLQTLPPLILTGVAVVAAIIFVLESKIYFKGVKYHAYSK